MNNYFNKEYIKECEDKKIQGLRKKLQFGDIILWRLPENDRKVLEVIGFVTGKKNIYFPLKEGGADFEGEKDDKMLWLPNGEQLDDEIEKQIGCGIYNFDSYGDEYGERIYKAETRTHYSGKDNTNRLIAKIKLLKELLKE